MLDVPRVFGWVRIGQQFLLGVVLCLTAYAIPAAVSTVAESGGRAPILCIGDSMTFGVGGDGVSYPGVLATRSGVPTINLGLPGWIPRHIVYHVFLHERPFVTREQLVEIPPSEYEHRKNQPDLDHLRVFLKQGQIVWVQESQGAPAVRYRWQNGSTDDSALTIKPTVVGDRSRRPATMTGRWHRDPSVTEKPPTVQVYCGIILWLGANGMEVDDTLRSLHVLLDELKPPHGHFLIIGLMNRVDTKKEPRAVEPWAKWISECNEASRRAFPEHFLDLQAWVTASGAYAKVGYHVQEWFPSASRDEKSQDSADQARGLLPGSLRAREQTTHLNATGYKAVGDLIYEWTSSNGWFESDSAHKHNSTPSGKTISST